MKSTYDKIEDVLKQAARPLAAHEFDEFEVCDYPPTTGREYVGQSESAIARRLREMREIGRVTSQKREGKTFNEYALAEKPVDPVEAFVHNNTPVGSHSGGL